MAHATTAATNPPAIMPSQGVTLKRSRSSVEV